METFPAFFPLAGRRVVVVGSGEAAEAKARLFEGSPATVDRVVGEAALSPETYRGASLVFIAGDDAFVEIAARAARAAGAVVNVVDHPQLCDFHTPAIVDRGQVVAAIGTAGAAPMMASLLRGEIEQRLPPSVGRLAGLLATRRDALRAAWPDLADRRRALRRMLLGPAAQAAEAGDEAAAARHLDAALSDREHGLGLLTLVERPPASDLLTLRALRALAIADIVAFDAQDRALVDAHARRDVERRDLDAPHALVEAALGGALVVAITSCGEALEAAAASSGVSVAWAQGQQ